MKKVNHEMKAIQELLIQAHKNQDWMGVEHYMKLMFIYAMCEK